MADLLCIGDRVQPNDPAAVAIGTIVDWDHTDNDNVIVEWDHNDEGENIEPVIGLVRVIEIG